MNIQNFLFGPYPLKLQTVDKVFIYVAVGFLALGLAVAVFMYFKKLNPVSYNLIKRFKNLFLVYGLSGLVWAAFRYEGARYLEWRFWYTSVAAGVLAWLVKIFTYMVVSYREDLVNFQKKQLKEKYLK